MVPLKRSRDGHIPGSGKFGKPCRSESNDDLRRGLNGLLRGPKSGERIVSLDQVSRTMYLTGLDMQSRCKETGLAGLALSVIEC